MNHIFLISKIVAGEKKYLRQRPQGDTMIYAVYIGEIVCFATKSEAENVIRGFDNPELWDIERFTR